MSRSTQKPAAGKAVVSLRSRKGESLPLFVTGTDTGVGKTVLTAMLVQLSRSNNYPVFAAKPFCTGNQNDVDILRDIQQEGPHRSTINPYFFQAPVAPLVAARKCGRSIPFGSVCRWARRVQRRAKNVVFEGCGGLLTPWGEGYDATDFMCALKCRAVLVAPNRLGVLNHVLLSVSHLRQRGIPCVAVVCMGVDRPDDSAATNAPILAELIAPTPVLVVPFLGEDPVATGVLAGMCRKLKKTLARLLLFDTVCAPFAGRSDLGRKKVRKSLDGLVASK